MKTEIKKLDLYNENKRREVIFYKGENFDNSDNKLVIFVHDAQYAFESERTFDKKSLELHSIVDQLGLDNCLVIGISSYRNLQDRFIEYAPYNFSRNMTVYYGVKKESNQGQRYIDALQNVFIPWAEKEFNFRWENVKKIMVGASMGGVITTYCALKYPNWFNGYISMSTAFWTQTPHFFDEINKFDSIGLYYHDMGSRDVTNYNDKVVGNQTDYRQGFENMNLFIHTIKARSKSTFVDGDGHNETFWKIRLPRAIEWMLKEEKFK